MSTNDNTGDFVELEPRLQRRAVDIGLFIVVILIGSFVLMINASKLWSTQVVTESWLLLYLTAAALRGRYSCSLQIRCSL